MPRPLNNLLNTDRKEMNSSLEETNQIAHLTTVSILVAMNDPCSQMDRVVVECCLDHRTVFIIGHIKRRKKKIPGKFYAVRKCLSFP